MARTFVVTLMANTGTSVAGATLDVTKAVTEIGVWSRDVEKEMTKVSPSEQSLTLIDLDGSIWSWLSSQIQVTGNSPALYPPWVFIDVDGTRAFTGFAYPRAITHDQKSGEISITAQDWSSSLNSKYLGSDLAKDDLDPTLNPWLRPYPRAAQNRPVATQVAGLTSISSYPNGYDAINWKGPEQFVEAGDYVTVDLHNTYPDFPAGKQYRVTAICHVNGPDGPDPNWWVAYLEGFGQDVWDHIHQYNIKEISATFTRIAQSTDLRSYYIVTKSVASDAKDVHVIDLDTVDGLNPADVMATLNAAEVQKYTVLQVDAQALQIVVKEEVTNLVANSSKIFFDDDTLKDLVLDDARTAIKRAVAISSQLLNTYSVDFSRFVPPTVDVPVLVWLPLRAMGSQDLSSVRDIDQGLTDFRVYGSGSSAWNGTPEAGWESTSTTDLRATWSDQLLAAPACTMPDERAALAPSAPTQWIPLITIIRNLLAANQADSKVPLVTLLYDYLQMRRIRIKRDRSITITPWSGTSWGTDVAATWPGTSPVLSANVFPGQPGTVIGMTSEGLRIVTLPTGASSNLVPIPAKATDAVLKTTPWGCYLVGSVGYGLITYTDGVLALNWVTLTEGTSSFLPNTFAALNANELMVMARFDGKANVRSDEVTTETHLLRLKATPSPNALDSILASEKLMDGAPRTCGAYRDATQPERVFGHCGGRLFVYGRTLPRSYAIERYTPSGLKAIELIEHVCQILNTVAIPDPLGCLHIVSRGLIEAPIQLNVDRVEVQDTRAWEHFYSVVRVSSAKDESILSDSWGTPGGEVLEYSSHPFLWTQSGCEALSQSLIKWFGVPRCYQEQEWFWSDPNTAAPWESLPPVATIQINGLPTKWVVLGIEDDKVNGSAKVKLVEVF